MYNKLIKIKLEHAKIKSVLHEIESAIERSFPVSYIAVVLKKFEALWNRHEKTEERLLAKHKEFGKIEFLETMMLEEHKQLKGHWFVLKKSLSSGDEDKARIALNTDGKMLVEKFYRHMNLEDGFIDSLSEAR